MSRTVGAVTSRLALGGELCLCLWKKLGCAMRGRRVKGLTAAETALLQRVNSDLSGFNLSAEEVFLPVGGRLMEIQSMARAVARHMSELAGQLSNHDASIASLEGVLLDAQGDGAGGRIKDSVNGLRQDVRALGSAIGAFGPILHTFDVLAVMTRVESARFADEEGNFAGLAVSVLELSQQIRDQVSTSAASVAALLQTVSAAAAEAGTVATQRQANLAPLIEQTSAGLRKIREQRSAVAHANAHLSPQFEGISTSVGDLVMALQSQDIVRQQIEHVEQALQAACGEREGRSLLPAIARLQAAQLDNARTVFESSVHRIRESLIRIEGNVSEVAVEATRLLGASEGSEPAFFECVRASLASTLSLLGSNSEAEHRLASTSCTVRQSLREIEEAITGVRAVGVMMQRIGLNATIQAARLGEAGASMEIVAHAIQELARQAEQASERTENLLAGIRAEANLLEATADSFGKTEAEIAGLRQDGAAFDEAQALAGCGYRRSMELIEGLKQRLSTSVEEFGTQDAAVEILVRASNALRNAAAEAPCTGPEDLAMVPGHYTMQSERSIHSAMTGPQAPRDDCPVPEAAETGPENDVEFF